MDKNIGSRESSTLIFFKNIFFVLLEILKLRIKMFSFLDLKSQEVAWRQPPPARWMGQPVPSKRKRAA